MRNHATTIVPTMPIVFTQRKKNYAHSKLKGGGFCVHILGGKTWKPRLVCVEIGVGSTCFFVCISHTHTPSTTKSKGVAGMSKLHLAFYKYNVLVFNIMSCQIT